MAAEAVVLIIISVKNIIIAISIIVLAGGE
jgi:hypothetical protein